MLQKGYDVRDDHGPERHGIYKIKPQAMEQMYHRIVGVLATPSVTITSVKYDYLPFSKA